NAAVGQIAVPDRMEVGAARDEAVIRAEPIAAEVAAVAGMQRLVQIAHQVDDEDQSEQPLAHRKLAIGEQPHVALDLRRDAIAVAAGRGLVEWPADVDILIMPGRRVAEAVAERLDA